jgi:hypothetical protein
MTKSITFFALTFTFGLAAFTAENYVKGPIQVIQDSENSFINGIPHLSGNIFIFSTNSTPTLTNKWAIWLRKLDTKVLTATANGTYNFTYSMLSSEVNYVISDNYLLVFTEETQNNIPQIRVYQQPLNGGATLPALIITSKDPTTSIKFVQTMIIQNICYVFYNCDTSYKGSILGLTNFVIGGAVGTNEVNVLNFGVTARNVLITWGEALGSTQFQASWVSDDIRPQIKSSIIDFKFGLPINPPSFPNTEFCFPYSTDKKWYGSYCVLSNWTQRGPFSIAITKNSKGTNSDNLVWLANYNQDYMPYQIFPYGSYLGVIFVNSSKSSLLTEYFYEIWDLDSLVLFKNGTTFLKIDENSSFALYRVQSGGVYSLLYNKLSNGSLAGISVGLLLGSTCITSVIVFVFTTIAVLLIF